MTRYDDKGRVYEHADENTTEEEWEAMQAARDAADAAALKQLRASGRLWNGWNA